MALKILRGSEAFSLEVRLTAQPAESDSVESQSEEPLPEEPLPAEPQLGP